MVAKTRNGDFPGDGSNDLHYIPAAQRRTAHRGDTGQVMWDLWWTKWRLGRFSPSTSVSSSKFHSTDCSTLIIIYHPELVQ
jgi:hypothetical protein